MDHQSKIGLSSGRCIIYLGLIFSSLLPVCGFSPFVQDFPSENQTELVYTPFSNIAETPDNNFLWCLYKHDTLPKTFDLNEQYIQNIVNHTVSVSFQVQTNQLLTIKGMSEPGISVYVIIRSDICPADQ